MILKKSSLYKLFYGAFFLPNYKKRINAQLKNRAQLLLILPFALYT